ncbi:MAG: SDR family oxidoreductase [Bacteroidales bacterium]|jgi:NAD(P)-dependent dehydrogenase (short-subunit alcohol dehydrogenase family)|nr:SDR family oxidoreductase [Bacteroidales bacterium]
MQKTILITGCLGGIGSVMVDFFREKGWFVIGTDKREAFSNADIKITTDLNKVEESTDQILETIDRNNITHIDALINNAAVQIKKKFDEFSYDDWAESFNVNVIAGYMLCKKLRKHLMGGSIVNIGSIHSSHSKKGFLIYATTKGAIKTMTQNLSLELAPDIMVNCIAPAAIDTPMLKAGLTREEYLQLKKFHPVDRIGSPVELSKLVYTLCERNIFLTGAFIEYDGGISKLLHDPEV